MGRNFLAGSGGDATNAVLAAIDYNFRRLLACVAFLWAAIWIALTAQKDSEPRQATA
jgi:IS5 family transposase